MRPSSIFTTGPNGCLASPADSTPASMVGSIVLASEVSLLLLVPTSKHKTRIKCAKEILRYLPPCGATVISILRYLAPQHPHPHVLVYESHKSLHPIENSPNQTATPRQTPPHRCRTATEDRNRAKMRKD